jgi:triosephosphate isomerase
MRALIAGNWKMHDAAAQVRATEAIVKAVEGSPPAADVLICQHAHIRQCLATRFGAAGKEIRILYGGSVNRANAGDFLAVPEVGGTFIGGASLKAADFNGIIRALPVQTTRIQHSAVA